VCRRWTALEVLRTHPKTVLSGEVRENPYFVPPEQLLDALDETGWTGVGPTVERLRGQGPGARDAVLPRRATSRRSAGESDCCEEAARADARRAQAIFRCPFMIRLRIVAGETPGNSPMR
jgi:hypothetical protein